MGSNLYFPRDCLFCQESFDKSCDKRSSCKLLFLVIYANLGCSHGCSLENISISSIPATVQVQLVDCITILVQHE